MFTAARWLATLLLFATHANADTWFLEPEPLPIVPRETLAHVGDFTGDGRNDLLYSDHQTVRVFPGQPGGTFGQPIETQLGSGNANVRAADFNGDGALDVWQPRPYFSKKEFAIFLGDGHGRFTAAVVLPAIGEQFAIGDFDRDGKADVMNSGSPQLVRVFFSGAVGDARVIDTSASLGADRGLVVADFDGDGWPDVAGTSPAAILWNVGGTGFVLRTYDFVVRPPWYSYEWTRITAGDIDGDGAADLVAHDGLNTKAYFGHRDRATFGKRRVDVKPVLGAVHLADLDGNGTADLIGDVTKGVAVMSGRRGGTLGPPKLYAASDETVAGAADVDGDSHLDVLVKSRFERHNHRDAFWLHGNGDGTLRANILIDACRVVDCKAGGPLTEVMDVNGDGRGDFVFITSDRLTVLPSTATADYDAPAITELGLPRGAISPLGDVNGDGRADLVVHRDPGAALTTWQVMLGQKDGTFIEGHRRRDLLPARGCGVADFDGDGNRDILDSRQRIHYGFGNGAFGEPLPLAPPTHLASAFCSPALFIDDLDANATTDLMVEHRTYINRGNGLFERGDAGWEPDAWAVAELTGDRFPDAVAMREVWRPGFQCCYQVLDHHVLSIWSGMGDGTFEPARGHATVPPPVKAVHELDFDVDGRTDLALGRHVLLGHGDGTFRTAVAVPGLTFRDDDTTGAAFVAEDGQLIAKVGADLYVPLQTVSGESAGIATTTSVTREYLYGLGSAAVARVTSTAPYRPSGAVRFTFGDTVVVVPVDIDEESPLTATAALDWDFTPGVSQTITATYMGDRHFAASVGTMQQHLPKYYPDIQLKTYDQSGPATTFTAGEQIRLTVSVTLDGKPVTGGTIEISSGHPDKVLTTVQGAYAEVWIDTATLLEQRRYGDYYLSADWEPDDPDYYWTGRSVWVRIEPPPPRKRSVRH